MKCTSSIICSFLFVLFSGCCHALTLDEGEQVAMVINKIETAAASKRQQEQDQRQLQGGAVSVADGCFDTWNDLFEGELLLPNNTALYLCDGFNDPLPLDFGPVTVSAGLDISISCLGICFVSGGGVGSGSSLGFFDVRDGGRLDLFGIDFENIAGAVATVSGTNSFLGVASCSFTTGGHELGGGNGGVFKAQSGGVLTVMGSTFDSNQADYGGVFELINSAALIVKDSNFTSNKALFSSGGVNSGGGGGVVHVRRAGTASFTNCVFDSNEAASNGGVADLNDANSKIKFIDSRLNANTAALRGGAIHARGSPPRVDVGGTIDILGACELTNNRAKFGGAINARATWIVTLKGPGDGSYILAEGNRADFANGDIGGFATTANTAQLIIEAVNIRDNISKGPGGALNLASSSPFIMSDSIMDINTADGNIQSRRRGDHIFGSIAATFGNDVCNDGNFFLNPSALDNGIVGVGFDLSTCPSAR